MKAGFIGLGSMRAPIARRLAQCGFDVVACDIAPQMLEAFDEPQTTREADPIATAQQVKVLGICVRTDEQLEGLADDGTLFKALGDGGLEGKLLSNLVSIANYGMSAAILDVGEKMGFDREQLRAALMAGSAQGFALQAVPSLLRPRGEAGAAGSPASLYQMLKKDVDHAKKLPPSDETGMAALLASCEAMLSRLQRAAVE